MQLDSKNIPERQFSIDKIFLAITLCVFVIITFLCRYIPFFWDGALYCPVAHYYYDTNFGSLTLPSQLDAYGSPMLFWMYIAYAWKILGRSLPVSHFALLPFLLGVVWEYYKLAKKFIQQDMIPWVLLLLVCEPTFMTQSITMSYDISKVYFFLLGLNSLLNKNRLLYSTSLVLLALCSTRGLMMAVFLIPIHFVLLGGFKNKKILQELKIYILPTIVLLAWACFHKYQTGWFFFSPNPEFLPDRKMASNALILRHMVFIFWQIMDLGRVFIWAFIVCGLFILRKRNLMSEKTGKLLVILSLLLLGFIITISPLAGQVCHRYFMVLFLLSHILIICILQEIVRKRITLFLLLVLSAASLISGNFWIYNGEFSNAWDSSLKVLPYFKLQNQMIEFTKSQHISPSSIGTKYPMHHNLKYTNLQEKDFHFTETGNDSIEKFQYILFSNISNTFTAQEKNTLNKWEIVKEYEGGQINLKLFKNPKATRITSEKLIY